MCGGNEQLDEGIVLVSGAEGDGAENPPLAWMKPDATDKSARAQCMKGALKMKNDFLDEFDRK